MTTLSKTTLNILFSALAKESHGHVNSTTELVSTTKWTTHGRINAHMNERMNGGLTERRGDRVFARSVMEWLIYPMAKERERERPLMREREREKGGGRVLPQIMAHSGEESF